MENWTRVCFFFWWFDFDPNPDRQPHANGRHYSTGPLPPHPKASKRKRARARKVTGAAIAGSWALQRHRPAERIWPPILRKAQAGGFPPQRMVGSMLKLPGFGPHVGFALLNFLDPQTAREKKRKRTSPSILLGCNINTSDGWFLQVWVGRT